MTISGFHNAALAIAISENPGAQTMKFGAAIRALDSAEDGDTEFKEIGTDLGIRPDAYLINVEKRKITLIEVEDTSALTEKKMSRIVNQLWFYLDCENWWLEILIYDRYGVKTHVIGESYFIAWIGAEIKERDSARADEVNDRLENMGVFV